MSRKRAQLIRWLPLLSIWGAGLASTASLAADDGSGRLPDLTFGGRIHQDFSHHYPELPLSPAPVDGSNTRRARLNMAGALLPGLDFDVEYDFAGGKSSPKDIKITWRLGTKTRLSLGHQKQPYSLALEMSSNDIPFVERSVDNELVDVVADRARGIRLEHTDGNWFFGAGIFRDGIHSKNNGDNNWSLSGRAVYAQPVGNEAVLHLGMRGLVRHVDTGDTLKFSVKTTAHSDWTSAGTGSIPGIERAIYTGPELAYARGRLMVSGEYTTARLERRTASSLGFSGWHLGASWVMGSATRVTTYKPAAGEFKGIKPTTAIDPASGEWGAVELALRYASIDLADKDIHGGRETTVNAAINWHLNTSARIQLDWTRILDLESLSPARIKAAGMDIITARMQYVF